MESPFQSWFEKPAPRPRSYSYHPSLFGVPVYPVEPTRETRRPPYVDRRLQVESKSGRKVVHVPVQFFGADSDRRSESALRIQKVFRGFLVRKSIRKIKEIKSQVDEIEVKLQRKEVVDMIRRNEKERLRIGESLMNLLFKLDGIRGIDLGVRLCRKGVTKKAIALQEKIDAMCATDSKVDIGNQELEDGVPAVELVGIELSAENGAASELEGSGFGNSENFDDIDEMLDAEEESKELDNVVREYEKLEIEKDSVKEEGNRSEETHVEMGIPKNGVFDEDNVESTKEVLVQNEEKDEIKGEGEGKKDDEWGNGEILANSGNLGEMLNGLSEVREGENEIMEVETNHLDAELVDHPVTPVVEVNREETPENLDFDEDNLEVVKEMLAYSDNHGEVLVDLRVELTGGNSVEEQDKTMEVENDNLDTEIVDIPVTSLVKASQETEAVKKTPKNPDFDVDKVGTVQDMVVEEKGELSKRKCDMLEQMMEENKKMMHMMNQLYERNETQLQMLDALTNRVEFLEKAYLCDKLRNRRKKGKKNKCALTCIDY